MASGLSPRYDPVVGAVVILVAALSIGDMSDDYLTQIVLRLYMVDGPSLSFS